MQWRKQNNNNRLKFHNSAKNVQTKIPDKKHNQAWYVFNICKYKVSFQATNKGRRPSIVKLCDIWTTSIYTCINK